MIVPSCREKLFRRRMDSVPGNIRRLLLRLSFSDVYFLELLGRNINTKTFSEILSSFFDNLSENYAENRTVDKEQDEARLDISSMGHDQAELVDETEAQVNELDADEVCSKDYSTP